MLEQLGCEVINLGIIRDDPHALRAAFIEADSQADVVISSVVEFMLILSSYLLKENLTLCKINKFSGGRIKIIAIAD